jgi:excisionase family DNA binding protein
MRTTHKLLTLKQVAEYLKVHKNTVYRLVNRKELPAFKVWHDWRFDLESIDRWRAAQEQAAKVCAERSGAAQRRKRGGSAVLSDMESPVSSDASLPVEDSLFDSPLVNSSD